MKRWSSLLLLLLLPLTMAPRTSLTPPDSPLALTAVVSRTAVEPGQSVTLTVQATNTTEGPVERAEVTILVGWDGKTDALELAVSPGCTTSEAHEGVLVSCRYEVIEAGGKRTMRVVARPLVEGLLTFVATSYTVLGPVPADQVIEVLVEERS